MWPFDTVLAAAGLCRYGRLAEASELLRSILEAAAAFEGDSLPELFCGTGRELGLPVPYEKANRSQSWSAAVPVLAAQLFLGIVPDAPRSRCSLSPWLPEWLPRLELRGIVIGGGRLDVCLARRDGETIIDELDARGIEIVPGTVAAPLWGGTNRLVVR